MSKRALGLLIVVATFSIGGVARATTFAIDPSTVDVGKVRVGSTSSADGHLTASLDTNVKLVASTGGDCGQFRVTPTTQFTVGPGGFDLTVQFNPTSSGSKTCAIHVQDPGGADLFTFNAAGTGALPQITVTSGPIDFGHVDVTVVSSPQTITVKNNGDATLTISGAALTAAADQYHIASGSTGNQTLLPDASTSWTVTCQPTSQDGHAGTFTVTSDATGTAGTTTNIALACTGDQGVLALTPPSFDFGGVAVNTTASKTFTLSNTGNIALTVVAGALDITNKGYAFDSATVPTTLAAGDSKQLTVTFKPLSGSDGGPANIAFTAQSDGHATSKVFGLNGDGQNVAYTVTPDTLAFGAFRFDSDPSKVYVIKNTGEAAISINQTFIADPGTATAEVGFVVRKGGAVVTLPFTLNAPDQLDVTVTLNPANRTGAIGGKLNVTSNFPTIDPPPITISGDAKAAEVTVSDLDFGTVDVDGPAVTKTIHLKNTGTAILDVGQLTKVADAAGNGDPAGINRFTLTLPTGTTHLDPQGELAIDVTYKPTVAKPAGSFDHFLLNTTLTGALNGPSAAMINVRGRGIDRVFTFASAPIEFPPTFRNPGDDAPTRTIMVQNTGEAVLKITAVMVTGDPVWQLVDAAPIDLPAGATHAFVVRFAPTKIGPAPAGEVAFMTDDNAHATGVVPLSGVGIGRLVAFGPATIDLGFTGVGIPVTAKVLAVSNTDTAAFKIRAIQLGAGSPFQVVDAPADELLPAMSSKTYALSFTPSAVGAFTTTATLFLDQDSEEQAEVTITGNAVFVDAHGGGGCNAGRDAGGGLLALGLAALLLRRRRRASAALVVCALGAGVAHADGVDVAVFEPTPSTAGTGFQVQSADVGPSGSFVVSSILSFASNPLVLEARDGTGKVMSTDAVIARSSELQLGAAFALLGRLELGAHLPLYTQSGDKTDAQTMFGVPPVSGTAVGNLALHGKVNLVRTGGFSLGAGAMVTIPTATAGQFTGSDNPAVHALVLAGYAPAALASRLSFSVNAGGVVRSKTEYANIVQKSGVAWGAGASVRILDPLWLTGEVFGEATPSGKRSQMAAGTAVLAPTEWLAGVRIQLDRRFTVGLAGGRGVTDALGTPEVRGMLSLAFVPGARQVAPIHPVEPPRPDGDADGDGIPDSRDKCPNEPEDKDMFEDEDGCPDLDNDHDGIPDAQDKCPNEPEDKDGFQDLDGCPDPDNDHDGIPDAQDKCPNEPETINGIQDEDGCPDKGDSTILLSPDRIELLDPVTFTGTKLTRASTPLLAQVAATLRAHTEIIRLRVTVHVQPGADADADQARSEKRAQVVRDWLVQWGIAPARVEARGFGGSKPLVPPDRKGAAKINDRLELIILERK